VCDEHEATLNNPGIITGKQTKLKNLAWGGTQSGAIFMFVF
jgi:hypothetical protein